MSSHKNIILFTESFPYGKGEQFLETEITYLAGSFQNVYIVPGAITGNARPVPTNCKILQPDISFKPQKKIRHYIFKHLKISLTVLWFTLLRSKDRDRYLRDFKNKLIALSFDAEIAENYHTALKPYLADIDVLYFYWFVNPVFYFTLLKQQGKIDQKLICRAHGYDYDEQQGRFPLYREYELKQVDLVAPVSRYGLNYLANRYSNVSYKAAVSYLGTNDHGETPVHESTLFHLVSCSAFHPVKRVHLIVDILKEIAVPVKWTHFGSGELEEMVREKARQLPANITVDFKGQVDNATVLKFYKENPVDLFINVSKLEGIPVSIMEAISFGIPVMGCNICGVPEIVTSQTGYLLEKEFNPKEVAALIIKHHQKPAAEKQEFRKGVKAFWQKTFNAANNYPEFITTILKGKEALCAA